MSDSNDPLDIQSLSKNYDDLILNLNSKTNELANKILIHVNEKKKLSDENLTNLNIKLKNYNNLLIESNNLLTEIDKLKQLQIFTNDFNNRLNNLTKTLKNLK